MTDTFITQCPHCQTSFRLKHSQLSAARGSVRCGACLQVFNAARQINPAQSPAPTIPQVAPAQTTHAAAVISDNSDITKQHDEAVTTASKKTLLIHDDMDLDDLDDLDLDEELARLEREEQQRSKELSGEFAALQASVKPSPAPIEDALENTQTALTDWSDELLAQEPVAQLSSVEPKAEEIETLEQPLDTAQHSSTTAHFQASAAPVHMEPMSGQLPNFSDGPLRLDWQPQKSPWRRWLAWGVLNICAILLLVGQYTYHNFAQLARQDSTRPWLEVICPVIDCQLPSKVDVDKIKSSNLLVRSHPDFSGALLVDAIIYNRASFSQPFPLLKLTFADQHGQVLASRLFKPLEYLGGELAGQQNMPQQTPIHIALEILEPSGGAVNYTLDFVSPD
ncbi:DUF3426 domain-containing protein [Denitrificimonas caeni]|uniref:DUF3426 domain-containing protein n=1 Tax=Denitrificimonas caeni TaxID=521720 RepID=UPI0003B498ED|nr:DUF3426 domain-containing protein [Denitrificimonas caeni]